MLSDLIMCSKKVFGLLSGFHWPLSQVYMDAIVTEGSWLIKALHFC